MKKLLIGITAGAMLTPAVLLGASGAMLLVILAAAGDQAAACMDDGQSEVVDLPSQGRESNARYIWAALLADGFTPQAAAGVLGNLEQESGLNPRLVQSWGPGMGLAQWSRGERWDGPGGLVPWARNKGLDEWQLETQVAFLLKEMHGGWGNFQLGAMRRMTDIEKATMYFVNTYEIPNPFYAEYGLRIQYAKQHYDRLKNVTDTGAGRVTTTVSRTTVSSSSRAQPLKKLTVVSPYGMRTHPTGGDYRMHEGVDLAAASGDPVFAATDGVVHRYPDAGDAGNYIELDAGRGLTTRYLHLSGFVAADGATVNAGDLIGEAGTTGNSTGPHLHFEVRYDGKSQDPMPWLKGAGPATDTSAVVCGEEQSEVTPDDCPTAEELSRYSADVLGGMTPARAAALCVKSVRQAVTPAAAKAVMWAFNKLDAPYLMGAEGPRLYDCGHFISHAYSDTKAVPYQGYSPFTGTLAGYNGQQQVPWVKTIPHSQVGPGDFRVGNSGSTGSGGAGHAQMWLADGKVVHETPPSSRLGEPIAADRYDEVVDIRVVPTKAAA